MRYLMPSIASGTVLPECRFEMNSVCRPLNSPLSNLPILPGYLSLSLSLSLLFVRESVVRHE